jgi:soluble lytic murein transglycosylase
MTSPRFPLIPFLLGLAVTLGSPALATQTVEPARSDQRAAFLAAEIALNRGNVRELETLKASLAGYPLLPYLEYAELRKGLARNSSGEIERFLKRYPVSPLADRLRKAWLDHLAKGHRWREYLHFYEPASGVARRCLYLRALLEAGRRQEAFAQVPDVWLHGKSRPKECDPVLDSWREAGKLTPKLVWQRIALAMEARQTRLAGYLERFVPARERAWSALWLELDRNPSLALRDTRLSEDHPWRTRMLLHAVKRQAAGDPRRAVQMWEQLDRRYDFSAEQTAEANRTLALALLRHDDPDSLERLDGIDPGDDDLRLHEARILAALSATDWDRVLRWIEALPQKQLESVRWRYWRSRALEALGRSEEAQRAFREVARDRSYYGFLAADRTGSSYNLQHIALPVGPQEKEQLERIPGFQRAHELYRLGRYPDARLEWHYATRPLSQRQLQVAAKLAEAWGWHDRAIFTLARTGYWDDLELRFPLEHRDPIEERARAERLDSAWVFAILRQESAFMEDARSPAGALGLMQLMPATAKEQSRIMGPGRRFRTRHLLDAEANIRLGAGYLGRVYQQLYQHPVLATAAYNAGPYRVRKWLPEEEVPADLWIETIPFSETRTYVRRVLAYTVIYQQRLTGETERISARLLRPIGTEASLAAQTAGGSRSQG